MRFQDLGLLPELVSNAGYDAATPVQSKSIPAILNGCDILAGAQTGTGKTAAFILPVMQKLYAGTSIRSPRALVLAPTRELTAQVADSARRYGKGLGLKQTSIFGGVSYGGQFKAIRSGLDLVVATPGRLIDHLNQGSIDLSKVQILILDEADRMLDMGFIRDIEFVISKCHEKRQTLLFSATYNSAIKRLASKYLINPVEVAVAEENTVAESVDQTFVHVDQHRKRELLTQMIGLNDMHQVLVFTKTKYGADRLATALTSDGLPAVAMHGNKSQAQRTKALQRFKRGAARVMVATDVAARGLDIQKLPYVINFELPMAAEDYVHRIGRTGRAGEKGDAISLVCATEHRLMRDIQHLLKINVELEVADGFEPAIQFPATKGKNKPQPRKHGSRGRNNGDANHKQKKQTHKTRTRYRDESSSKKKTSQRAQAQSRQSSSEGTGLEEKQKKWGRDFTSPYPKKPQKSRTDNAKHCSDKATRSTKNEGSQNQSDGFVPPKRKPVKRAISIQ
ncbi:MAG TPA: RNA helicase [Gammaproteobacteria bacterium]|nr:RNA helicase [Gammaproteobacteria bacterium]